MTSPSNFRPAVVWQYRVLGLLWFGVGLVLTRWFFRGDFWWHDKWPYVPLIAGVFCFLAGASSVTSRTWARAIMLPLAAVTGLAAFDLLLFSVFENPQDFWLALFGVALAVYTVIFILVSCFSSAGAKHATSGV